MHTSSNNYLFRVNRPCKKHVSIRLPSEVEFIRSVCKLLKVSQGLDLLPHFNYVLQQRSVFLLLAVSQLPGVPVIFRRKTQLTQVQGYKFLDSACRGWTTKSGQLTWLPDCTQISSAAWLEWGSVCCGSQAYSGVHSSIHSTTTHMQDMADMYTCYKNVFVCIPEGSTEWLWQLYYSVYLISQVSC